MSAAAEIYPFATDLRPTGTAPTFDRLTRALARARYISASATARHCADPSPVSLSIARAAVRGVAVARARWVRHAFDSTGNYSAEVLLP